MYQPKGDYQPTGDYALKGDLSMYQPKGDYQPKGNYQATGDYALKGDLSMYQPKGNYQPVGDYALKGDLSMYQPKGNYQPVGDYASKGDLGAYQPKGDYVSKADLGGYQVKGEYQEATRELREQMAQINAQMAQMTQMNAKMVQQAQQAPQQVMCKADGTWSNNSPVSLGTVITRECPTGGFQTATCRADGGWDMNENCLPKEPVQAVQQLAQAASSTTAVPAQVVIPTANIAAAAAGDAKGVAAIQALANQAMQPQAGNPDQVEAAKNVATQSVTSAPTKPKRKIGANPGQAISCLNYNPKGAGAIYRYEGNMRMRHYPNPEIASSWDPNWPSGVNRKIDCTGFTLDPDVIKKI